MHARVAVALCLVVGVTSAPIRAQTITAIGNFTPTGLSADALAASGYDGGPQAVRWTSGGGVTGLGYLDNDYALSYGWAISADGSTVAGNSGSTGGPFPNYQAFRWTQPDGMVALGAPGGWTNSNAVGVSSNGAIIAGTAYNQYSFYSQAYIWSGGTFQVLPTTGGNYGYAYGLSADGTTVVGVSTGPDDQTSYAALWRNGVATSLGPTVGSYANTALSASANGNVVAGYSNYTGTDKLAFRWTQSGGMLALSPLAGSSSSIAYAASPDGVITGGNSSGIGGQNATIWDATGTPYSLYDLITAQSGPPGGWILQSITSITGSNGNFNLLGTGSYLGNPQDFIVTGLNFTAIPEPAVNAALTGLMAVGGAAWIRRHRRSAS